MTQNNQDIGYFTTDFWAAGNHSRPDVWVSENHYQQFAEDQLPYHASMSRRYHYDDTLFDSQLESEFSRLTLGTTTLAGRDSFSYAQPPFSPVDIQRMRIESAARAKQFQEYHYFDNSRNDRSLYNSSLSGGALNRRSLLNGDAINYQPQASLYEIGHGSSLNLNRNIENTNRHMRPITNSLSMISADSISRPRQRPNFSSLKDLRGKISSVAKDQNGCRFLQNKFEEGKPEEIQMIFVEVKDHICDLMTHQFGNYLIQKFLEVCNQEQMTQLLLLVISDELEFTNICTDMYGTRAVQKLLEHLTTSDQRCHVISVLRRITVALTKSMNGHHVIQYCLKFFSIEDNQHILNVVADNCIDIATDKSGCCVLQQCVEHALGEPRERLISEITSNALVLSEHPYGNYVVQYILGLKLTPATANIMAQLTRNYVSLSMNKYGSNVVERCLRESEEYQILPIIEEIINSPHFLRVLQDPYGNYVAQSALAMSKGALRHAMLKLILLHQANLHSHPHGKRVLARTKGIKMCV